MLRENRVKRMMKEGKVALGGHISFTDPALVEILGFAGLDAAFIDMEHTTLDAQTVENLIRAAELVGITPIVRVPDHNEKTILRLLEAGAQGIQAPHVQTPEEARELVKAVRYAPMGERGAAGGSRAAGYGSVPWAEHVRRSNEEVLLLAMCEDKKGLENLDAIASVDGVDIVVVAPTDLSESLGLRGQFDALRRVYGDIAARVHRIGKAKLSVPLGHPAMPFTASELKALGVAYASVHPSMAARLMKSFSDDVTHIRQQMGG
ncbi:MAG: aldolase/citrate lyase family protein [Chloroflexota bacterium]